MVTKAEITPCPHFIIMQSLSNKQQTLFIAIGKCRVRPFASLLVKQTKMTAAYGNTSLNKFLSLGLVEFDRVGRVKYISYTSKGLKLRELLTELYLL